MSQRLNIMVMANVPKVENQDVKPKRKKGVKLVGDGLLRLIMVL